MVSLTGHSPQPPNSVPKICSACGGPTRGHSWQGTRTNRKLICPSPEKLNEILLQLWNEGHHEFVRGIIARKGMSFPSLPSPPISPEPSTSRNERILRRKSTSSHLGHQPETGTSEKEKHKAGDTRTSVAGSLRRILSVVIDQEEPNPLRSPPRSRSPSPISLPGPDVPIAHPDDLPAVGPWNAQRRKEWVTPPAITEMPEGDTASLVPTLLIDSDGHTIREGSRAEAHFRAQAAFEARQRSQQQRQRTSALRPLYEDEGSVQALSVLHVDDDDHDYEGSGFLRVLRSVMVSPVIVAIPVRYEDIPRVQETAARQGLHTSVLDVLPRNPSIAIRILPQALRNSFIKRTITTKSVNSEDDNRPIVVIGRNPEMTQRYVEMAQRGIMPGTIALDREMLSAPRLITMTQLIFISFFTVALAWTLFFFFLL